LLLCVVFMMMVCVSGEFGVADVATYVVVGVADGVFVVGVVIDVRVVSVCIHTVSIWLANCY